MGVTGLWRLIEPAGKPVPVETLENKVLAVDISIWLHQMVKGYQDAKGAPLPNAHLMGLFQRVCKLLYFRIKPVFVFDGGFPDLKRETIAKRQDNKSKYNSESERIRRELALILSKRTAIGSLLGKQISPKKAVTNANNDEDLFKLPEMPQQQETESESEEESSSGSSLDVHSIDIESEKFKNLSAKEKLDLLVEMKETRKMNSWGKIHELPKKSNNFSDFQMQRLLKRRKVQACLEETEKEMGESGMSLNELESLLNEEGIDTNLEALPTRRIAADNTTRYLLISDVKQALADAKKKEEEAENKNKGISDKLVENKDTGENKPNDELEEDLQKAIKMSMECVEDSNISACTSKADDSWTSNFSDSEVYEMDSEEEDGYLQPQETASAKAYIMQYSDFTHNMINRIVSKQTIPKSKDKVPHINQILEELNNEKTIIEDNIELSSSEDDSTKECVLAENVNDKSGNAMVSLDVTNDDQESSNNQDEESVVCIENNAHESVILLDSTLEEDPFISTNQNNVNEKSRINSQSSTECVEIIKNKHIHVKINESNENTNLKEQIVAKSESESSDDDFEEVTETDHTNKNTVVELILNVGNAPEDDIFADIFNDVKYTPDKSKDKLININDKPVTDVSSKTEDNLILQDSRNTVNDLKTINKKSVISKSDTKIIKFAAPISTSIVNDPITKSNVPDTISTEVVQVVNPSESLNKNIATEPPTNERSKTSEAADSNNERIALETAVINEMNNKISAEILNTMDEEMQTVEQNLVQEKGRMDRIGRNITEQMTKEAQELLQIFGIPYIIAPMEAEAQCAFLESVKLTDGTITDDSDIWLFGGRTVYKNFFNQKKHVLQFLAERIERSFNLSREKLILLALLVGSDYTTGVNGVGPVTALEILASFPLNKKAMNETSEQAKSSLMVSGLQEFKQWIRAGRRTSNNNLKKKLKNVNVTDDFPSVRVVQAYLRPNVETNEESFTWGNLDITVLRDYAKTKFGWSQNKLDEIVKPVLQRLSDAKKQKSVRDYFQRKIDFQCLEEQMSKRVKAAVQKMNPDAPEDQNVPETEKVKSKPARKRKNNKSNKESLSVNRDEEAGPSEPKTTKTETDILANVGVRVVSEIQDGKSSVEIKINKIDRFQEMIPQREKDKQSLLQNKMKAIEIFRKTNLVRKKSKVKKRVNLPKEKAELSESSDSD